MYIVVRHFDLQHAQERLQKELRRGNGSMEDPARAGRTPPALSLPLDAFQGQSATWAEYGLPPARPQLWGSHAGPRCGRPGDSPRGTGVEELPGPLFP